ncbi:hypothetical protein [Spirosoma sordidisoli]|uniref:Uncharacterized protein n=1 Tax=Spirosoma sordidisoli TaxID=2502893 RepID=A0A4Q2UGC7_9BACT|nr:hypothetical protein [Spirosoma sordidisoli]RYC66310.1 hypothetical protein EQG79_30000 [Spirosoma sordidisoli]
MKYFIKLNHVYAANNRLQKALADTLPDYDRRLVERPEHLADHLRAVVDRLNRANPRCQPIAVSYHPSQHPYGRAEHRETVHVGELATFTLYRLAEPLAAPAGPVQTPRPPAPQGEQLRLL